MIKPRLLFISSCLLFPIIVGDQIRTVQQLEFLLEKFDVDVLLISPDKEGINNNKEIPGVRNRQKSQKGNGGKAREYIKSNLSREVISKQFWTFINSVEP